MIYAFDCFGTIFDASAVPPRDVEYYAQQVRQGITPLTVPPSFSYMRAHPDVKPGLERLRSLGHRVVTCSNLPLDLLWELSNASALRWDMICPVEVSGQYKPDIRAYTALLEMLQAAPHDVTVVTTHLNGPDAKGAPAAGMHLQFLRQPGYGPLTVGELV